MPSDIERSLSLRRFSGVNRLIDSAFLRGDELFQSDNWVPDKSFLLRKRFGTVTHLTPASVTSAAKALLRVYRNTSSQRLLYIVASVSGTDTLLVSTNDGAFASVTAGTFTTPSTRYGITIFNRRLYVSNDTDSIKVVDIETDPTTATALDDLVAFTDTSTPALTVATGQKELVAGTHAYTWGVYDTATRVWSRRSQSRTVQVDQQQRVLTFTAPAGGDYTLSGTERFHLFVAPVNLPHEFGHDQTPAGLANAATFVLNEVSTNGVPTPTPNAVKRKGRILVVHRSRLWITGDVSDPRQVATTNVLVPGLESALFNQGEFFPLGAELNMPDSVTGLGVVTTGGTSENPASPIAIFTRTKSYLFFGDIVDDPTAVLIELSNYIGCISHRSIRPTPLGLMWCGERSVYLLQPNTTEIVDVGWPITPDIEEIPPSRRSSVTALYHKGFYKLAYTPVGGSQNTRQFWLDLRRGLLDVPSWWGPHTHLPILDMTNAERDQPSPVEIDRAFGVRENVSTGEIVRLDQSNTFTDVGGTTIVSILKTPNLDFGEPFLRKLFARTRVIGLPQSATETVTLEVMTDEGDAVTASPLIFAGVAGEPWDTAVWDTSSWADVRAVEGESIYSDDRPRGRTIQVTMTHAAARGLKLRDFEERFRPIERAVE